MSTQLLRTEELQVIIRNKGFSVELLAVQVGLDLRMLERFCEQFCATPKAWIMRER